MKNLINANADTSDLILNYANYFLSCESEMNQFVPYCMLNLLTKNKSWGIPYGDNSTVYKLNEESFFFRNEPFFAVIYDNFPHI